MAFDETLTEAEWLECADPQAMLHYLHGRVRDRKLRLFGCACCRGVWDLLTDECFRNAVQIAERFADGLATKKELAAARKASGAALEQSGLRGVTGTAYGALGSAWSTTRTPVGSAAMYPIWVFTTEADRERQVALLRDLFGNPFRLVAVDSSWLTPVVVQLAQAIYDERAFDRMPVLTDALEEAGCINADILAHCRQPGEHVRGCWVVDLILGKG